jgi:hypothetical protein
VVVYHVSPTRLGSGRAPGFTDDEACCDGEEEAFCDCVGAVLDGSGERKRADISSSARLR